MAVSVLSRTRLERNPPLTFQPMGFRLLSVRRGVEVGGTEEILPTGKTLETVGRLCKVKTNPAESVKDKERWSVVTSTTMLRNLSDWKRNGRRGKIEDSGPDPLKQITPQPVKKLL